MRIIFIRLTLSLIPFLSQAQQGNEDTTLYKSDHYTERMAIFKNEPIIEGRTIFLGNSITEFCDWKSLLNDSTAINRGIAGDNTYGVLSRLSDIIIRKPRKLFIEIGINDFALDPKQQNIVRNILLMVKQIRSGSPHTMIVIVSILPTNDNVKTNYPFAYNKAGEVNIINSHLAKIASSNSYFFANLSKVLQDKNGKLNPKLAMDDGIHLNQLGYQKFLVFLKSKGFI
jgi:lysophospholipase L1-like esterase